jgi:hypothetical protein
MAIYTKGRDPAYHPALRLADRLGLRIALHLMIAGVRGMLLYIAAVNFRAKRLLQASGRFALITAMLVSSCQGDWLAITAANLQQTRPVCSPDESRSRRYSAKTSRGMPGPPSTEDFHDRREDQTRPGLLFPCFNRLSACSNGYTAYEAPRLRRRKPGWHTTSIYKLRIDFQKVRYIGVRQ